MKIENKITRRENEIMATTSKLVDLLLQDELSYIDKTHLRIAIRQLDDARNSLFEFSNGLKSHSVAEADK